MMVVICAHLQTKKIELEILSEWLRGLEPGRNDEYGLAILCVYIVLTRILYLQVSQGNFADPRCK